MIVTRENVWCKVQEEDPAEIDWLNDYLAFENRRAFFQGRSDLKERMFKVVDRLFPSGYFDMVMRAAKEEGFKFSYTDARTRWCAVDPKADLSWLRDYQLGALRKMVARERGIVWLPTGAGKTELAIALWKALPCRWLFLVHRRLLAEQTAARFGERTGYSAGLVVEGQCDPSSTTLFDVATFQSMWAGVKSGDQDILSLLANAQGLIVDEAHVLPAESFHKVAMHARNAYFRFGLSGTPLARGDNRSALAVGALGPVIHRIRPKVLIDAGVLAAPKIHFVPVHQFSSSKTWQGVYGECIVRSVRRNRAVVVVVKQAAKPVLVFVKEIGHGRRLLKMLTKAGLKAEFAWGASKNTHRGAALKRLVRGDIDVLVCSVIMQEGVDIPSLASVVVASGGRSAIAAIQRVGRGMRTDGGRKTEFEVWEFEDEGNRILERQSKARKKAYLGEGYSVQTTVLSVYPLDAQEPLPTP